MFKNNQLSDASIKIYIRALKHLNGGKNVDSLEFLDELEVIGPRLKLTEKGKQGSDATLMLRLGSIISSIHTMHGNEGATYKHYKELHDKIKKKILADKMTGVKTKREEEAWVSLEDMKKKLNELKEGAEKEDATQMDKLKYFILSLYINIEPRRLTDYSMMKVLRGKAPANIDQKYNYLDLDNDIMVFNVHKNARHTGQEIINITNRTDFKKSLELYLTSLVIPLKKNTKLCVVPLLQSNKGDLLSGDVIRSILNKIFDGKKVGTNMIRKITHTSSVPKNFSKIMIDFADRCKAMGHNPNTALTHYLKTE
jgi:hypothetical protein